MASFISTPTLQVSHNDKRQYRYLTLENGLCVTLIHDEATEKSSACVDVRVGSMSDPADMPGLAHFLEHMLFLGAYTYLSLVQLVLISAWQLDCCVSVWVDWYSD